MGLSFSRIRSLLRFSKSPDVYKKELETINKEVAELEKKKTTLEYQYCLIKEFITSYSRIIYLVVVLVFFFSTLPSTLFEYIMFIGPMVVFYILISTLRKSLKWYYEGELKKCIQKIIDLQLRKKNIFSEVKIKVKFNDAKHIIEEYSRPVNGIHQMLNSKSCNGNFEFQDMKKRQSSVDNVVNFLLNEEKENSLICRYCQCHNGMALAEDYNFVSFRCCRCSELNDANDMHAHTSAET